MTVRDDRLQLAVVALVKTNQLTHTDDKDGSGCVGLLTNTLRTIHQPASAQLPNRPNHLMKPPVQIVVGCIMLLLLCAGIGRSDAQERVADATVISAIRKATTFYRDSIAVHGGYVYYYSVDLSQRWGEGLATSDEIWVQPPGTPTVGMAYLDAYAATGEEFYLDAAREAAEALVYGQLRSGGWANSIDLKGRKLGYRYAGGNRRKDGTTSLDDGQTQSAIRFMVLVDEALKFKHPEIHQSSITALDALLAAQFPNGAFPQGWKAPVSQQPVLKASYPAYDWRSEGRIKNYWDMYTLNDNVCGYVADALATADRVYHEDKYQAALKRLGDFLILAQMPDPQPAWAQQYNYDMHPIWARKFEPPGISGDESQEVIETLMNISIATGDRKYLDPIPRALDYLKRSLLPDGRLARYYELETNKPLYMLRRSKSSYVLTYEDSNLPAHYGWKWDSRIGELERRYDALKSGREFPAQDDRDLASDVRRIVDALDDQGRWLSTYDGERLVGQPKFPLHSQYLSSAVFSHNLSTLCRYLTTSRPE
jgi:PelA/Pel-15E family pectate lyase